MIDMLKGIWEVLTSIVAGLTTCIDFVIDTVMNLDEMLVMLTSAIAYVPTYVGWLPPAAVTLVTMTMTAALIFKLVGRSD